MIVERFAKHLTAIEYPKEKTSWNIAGIIKGTNAFYRFDVRDLLRLPNEELAQKGRLDSKAQKMVIEGEKDWLVLDLEELHKYIRREKKRKVYVKDLISDLEWTISLVKN
tara:strand:+ start:934 stop:1263 length:330 start_codon:yes stop_codon:yes gene_type:complete